MVQRKPDNENIVRRKQQTKIEQIEWKINEPTNINKIEILRGPEEHKKALTKQLQTIPKRAMPNKEEPEHKFK